MKEAESIARTEAIESGLSDAETSDLIASMKLEASYIGIIGKCVKRNNGTRAISLCTIGTTVDPCWCASYLPRAITRF